MDPLQLSSNGYPDLAMLHPPAPDAPGRVRGPQVSAQALPNLLRMRRARSSVGESPSLLSWLSQVRFLPGAPHLYKYLRPPLPTRRRPDFRFLSRLGLKSPPSVSFQIQAQAILQVAYFQPSQRS